MLPDYINLGRPVDAWRSVGTKVSYWWLHRPNSSSRLLVGRATAKPAPFALPARGGAEGSGFN